MLPKNFNLAISEAVKGFPTTARTIFSPASLRVKRYWDGGGILVPTGKTASTSTDPEKDLPLPTPLESSWGSRINKAPFTLSLVRAPLKANRVCRLGERNNPCSCPGFLAKNLTVPPPCHFCKFAVACIAKGSAETFLATDVEILNDLPVSPTVTTPFPVFIESSVAAVAACLACA